MCVCMRVGACVCVRVNGCACGSVCMCVCSCPAGPARPPARPARSRVNHSAKRSVFHLCPPNPPSQPSSHTHLWPAACCSPPDVQRITKQMAIVAWQPGPNRLLQVPTEVSGVDHWLQAMRVESGQRGRQQGHWCAASQALAQAARPLTWSPCQPSHHLLLPPLVLPFLMLQEELERLQPGVVIERVAPPPPQQRALTTGR